MWVSLGAIIQLYLRVLYKSSQHSPHRTGFPKACVMVTVLFPFKSPQIQHVFAYFSGSVYAGDCPSLPPLTLCPPSLLLFLPDRDLLPVPPWCCPTHHISFFSCIVICFELWKLSLNIYFGTCGAFLVLQFAYLWSCYDALQSLLTHNIIAGRVNEPEVTVV